MEITRTENRQNNKLHICSLSVLISSSSTWPYSQGSRVVHMHVLKCQPYTVVYWLSPTLQLELSTYGTLVPLQPALHVAAVLVLESHSWTYKLYDSQNKTIYWSKWLGWVSEFFALCRCCCKPIYILFHKAFFPSFFKFVSIVLSWILWEVGRG